LAKVLIVPPKLLVADELSLGLAPVVVGAVYEGLEAINRNGTALLVVEQQVDRVLKLANKALVLDRGRVVYDGDPSGAGNAIDQLLTRREKAGAEAVAIVELGEGVPETSKIADAVVGEHARAGRHEDDVTSANTESKPE
jgi:ABC-type multidrug transport system ATPase subunit